VGFESSSMRLPFAMVTERTLKASANRSHWIQPCCWNLGLIWSAISLAVALALPSSLLLPLSSP
jgi:hypothetical protein